MPAHTNMHTTTPEACPDTSLSKLLDQFDMDEILNCMQCGFCLPSCPTYRQTGKESASPRGRIALMKGVATELLQIDEEFEHNMYLCLGCRACETACPAGVPYGSLVETARDVVESRKKQQGDELVIRDLIFNEIFPNSERMELMGNLLWMAQATGLQALAQKTGLMKILPRPMREMAAAVDTVASPWQRMKREAVLQPEAASVGLTIGMFKGCVTRFDQIGLLRGVRRGASMLRRAPRSRRGTGGRGGVGEAQHRGV